MSFLRSNFVVKSEKGGHQTLFSKVLIYKMIIMLENHKNCVMRQFDYYSRANDNRPKLCTVEVLNQLLDAPKVSSQVAKVRLAATDEERQKMKAQLPAICWHGHCTAEARSKANTIPSGLAMLDLDGTEASPLPTLEGKEEAAPLPSLEGKGAAETLNAVGHPQWIDDLVARLLPSTDSVAPSFRRGLGEAPSGICLVHITPSGNGLRIVGDMEALGCHTIQEWQQKMADMLELERGQQEGLYHIDTCVKDLSRISFMVPRSEVLYLNESLLWQAPSDEWMQAATKADTASGTKDIHMVIPSTGSGFSLIQEGVKGEATDSALTAALAEGDTFTYNGHTITEIANKWLEVYGHPVKGERHSTYMKLCRHFKNICDQSKEVLLAQLPTFDKPEKERYECISYVLEHNTSATLDRDFKDFLIHYGFRAPDRTMSDIRAEQSAQAVIQKVEQDEADRLAREEQQAAEDGEEMGEEVDTPNDWGKYPSVYNIYRRILPVHLRKPAVLALDAIMGTYFTNLTARYASGEMERPCFHNLIIGPPSSGKGTIDKIYQRLTARLQEIDDVSLAKAAQYDKEVRRKKGARELPPEPEQHYRLLESTFSQSSLLKRQEQGGGLHQLVFVSELDGLFNKGNHKDFDKIYRLAYEMETQNQFYLSKESFNGRVKLLLNVLGTGTPLQFAKHYPNAENGLISRVNWHRITEQFIQDFKPIEMNDRERAYINKVIDFALSLSYGEDEEGNRIILPPKDISEEMAFMLPVCEKFLKQQKEIAVEACDDSRDQFRKRIAVDMFRGAMVDWGCALGKLDEKRKQAIINFRLAKAEEMIERKVAEFGQQVNKAVEVLNTKYPSLYEAMPDTFTLGELIQKAKSLDIESEGKKIACIWKKNGLILSKTKGQYEKVTRKSKKQ